MLKNISDDALNLFLDAAEEKYRRAQAQQPMVQPQDLGSDFQQGPQTDAQKGEQAGNNAVNSSVDAYNKDEMSGRSMRRNYSPETDQMMSQEADANAQKTFDQNQFNIIDPGRTPQSETNPFSSGAQDLASPVQAAATTGKTQNPDYFSTMKDVPVPQQGAQGSVKQPDLAQAGKNLGADAANTAQANLNMSYQAGKNAQDAAKAEALGKQGAYNDAARMQIGRADFANGLIQQAQAKTDQMTQNFQDEQAKMLSVDPARLFNNASTIGKLGFFISAAAGGLKTGGALNNLIQDDIKAQQQDIATQGTKANNYLSLVEKYVGNRQMAAQIYSDSMKSAIEAAVEAKKAGIGATDEVLNKTFQDEAGKWVSNYLDKSIGATKVLQEQQKLNQEAANMDIKNQQEKTKINQEAAKLNIEKGQTDVGEMPTYNHVSNASIALDTINNLRRKGVDPTSANFKAFASQALQGGFSPQAIATGLSLASIPSSKKADYLKMARAFQDLNRETAIDESGNRISPDKLNEYMKTNMPRFIDNEESLNGLLQNAEDKVRTDASSLSGKMQLRLLNNLPYTKKYLQKSTLGK